MDERIDYAESNKGENHAFHAGAKSDEFTSTEFQSCNNCSNRCKVSKVELQEYAGAIVKNFKYLMAERRL